MNNRTARRHKRRGIDRKQLVKRLFKLVWTEQLNLEWDKDTQQAISFCLIVEVLVLLLMVIRLNI